MKKILVIDDAEFILETTATILKFEGYEVKTATDGEKGIQAALGDTPDLILCDISMPVVDGYEVLDKIRSTSSTSTIPFIFLTAFTEKSELRKGMEKGADDFIVKPYTREELVNAIDAQWIKHQLIEQHLKVKVDEVGRNVTYALPHEFRTVLNEVIGTAKYLKSTAEQITSSEIEEFANDIIFSANRLLRITENFLAFVKIESLATDPEKVKQLRMLCTEEPVAVIEDIAAVKAEKFKRIDDLLIEEKVNRISVEISTENFYKVVDELIDNAFKFSNQMSKVRIKTYTKGQHLFISISDEGRGMTKEQINGVAALAQFERTIYEQQGVGMGLVIAKRIVELHGGDFFIESSEGIGTTITFSLFYKNV